MLEQWALLNANETRRYIFRHNVAAPYQPRPTAWVMDPRLHAKPRRGGPNWRHTMSVTFITVIYLGSPRWGWYIVLDGFSPAVGLGWHRSVPLGLRYALPDRAGQFLSRNGDSSDTLSCADCRVKRRTT